MVQSNSILAEGDDRTHQVNVPEPVRGNRRRQRTDPRKQNSTGLSRSHSEVRERSIHARNNYVHSFEEDADDQDCSRRYGSGRRISKDKNMFANAKDCRIDGFGDDSAIEYLQLEVKRCGYDYNDLKTAHQAWKTLKENSTPNKITKPSMLLLRSSPSSTL